MKLLNKYNPDSTSSNIIMEQTRVPTTTSMDHLPLSCTIIEIKNVTNIRKLSNTISTTLKITRRNQKKFLEGILDRSLLPVSIRDKDKPSSILGAFLISFLPLCNWSFQECLERDGSNNHIYLSLVNELRGQFLAIRRPLN